jgi:hypothetical protein
MNIEDVEKLSYGAKLIDILTDEEVTFVQYNGLDTIMAFGTKGITIWLPIERIKIKDD